MEKRKWLWKRKSSERSPGETESSGSVSSHSERFSDEQDTSKASQIEDSLSPEVTSKTSERDEDVDNRIKKLTEKLSAALVNVSAKDDLVKQHSKVAEEAVAGWEKAENEVTALKQQLEAAVHQKTALEDRVTHLDGALKECVRQLRQAKDELEQNVQDALAKKTQEWESTKTELENQISELKKVESETAMSASPQIDQDFYEKLEHLEKSNATLKLDLFSISEELEVRTIERDLSTRAAETASKQHLESIKKVAKLEAECRRLKAAANSSQSESAARLNPAEPWASALIAELDQFKEANRNISSTSIEIDLMDDFLEMERLLAMPETEKTETLRAVDSESSLRAELDVMIGRATNLEEKLRKMEGEKVELEEKLEKMLMEKTELETMVAISRENNEELQNQLREAGLKLEELQEELLMANESRVEMESQLVIMEAEVRTTNSKANAFEAEAEKEKGVSVKLDAKCKALEEELCRTKTEIELQQSAISNTEPKIKQEDIAAAAGKLAECQKTIASLGQQLKSLATLEDFLIDSVNVPEKFSPNRDSTCLRSPSDCSGLEMNKNEGPLSMSSSVVSNSRNGFAKFFSRGKNGNGIQLEI